MQIRKQTGNSVAVPVVHAIAEKMLEALRQRKPMIGLDKQKSCALPLDNKISLGSIEAHRHSLYHEHRSV